MKRYFLLWILLSGIYCSFAQEGSLDSSFSSKGWNAFDVSVPTSSSDNEYTSATLRQSDGKLIVVFQGQAGTQLARYNTDGSLDKTFGIEGFSAASSVYPFGAALQSDGQIVVVGETWNGSNYIAGLTRFTINGKIDTSFGINGKMVVDLAPGYDSRGTAVGFQSSGKILVTAGAYNYTTYYDFIVMRFNANGSLDNTFEGAGIVKTDFAGDHDEAYNIAVLPDDKFIVCGYAYVGNITHSDFAMAAYNADGTINTSFGSNGKTTANFSGYDDYAYDIAIQPNGKILLGGETYSSGYIGYFGLIRFSSDGTVDEAFGSAGRVTTDFEGYNSANSIAIQGADTVLLAGQTSNSSYVYDMALARYTPDGALDNNFGTGGKVIVDFYGLDDYASTVLVQPDGKIVLGGTTYSEQNSDIGLARFTKAGIPDVSFNTTGKMTSFFPLYTRSYACDAAVQTDGKLVVGGYAYNVNTDDYDFYVARFNADGSPDINFGQGGMTMTDFSSTTDHAYAIAIQSDGKILLAGYTYSINDFNYNIALARYLTNGTLDNTFGTGGKVITDISSSDQAYAITVLSNGFLVAGLVYNDGADNSDFLLLRYTTAGVLDNTFGTGGIVKTDFNGGNDAGYGMAVQTDGKIDVVGQAYGTNSYDFGMVRYNSNGTIDNTFGTGGKVTTDFGGGSDAAYKVAIQPDGKIVVAGFGYSYDTYGDAALVRYSSTGVLDNGFGSSGKVTFDLAGSDDYAGALMIQPDGKILVGGSSYNGNINEYLLLRYTGTGSLDNSFGTAGKVISDLYGYDLQMSNAFIAGNRLYTAGTLYATYNYYSIIAVYKISQPAAGNPLISINDVTVNENAGTATLTVSLNKPSTSAITVNYATDDSTAVSKGRNVDYKSAKGAVTIAKGAQSAPISITIKTDNQNEGNEYFKLVLSLTRKMTGLVGFADSVGVVTIVNVSGLSSDAPANNGQAIQEMQADKLGVKASPNPSAGYFTLEVQTASSAPVSLIVTDASGRIVETRTVSANRNLQLGSSYRPGVYYAQLVQNDQKVVVKLLKQ